MTKVAIGNDRQGCKDSALVLAGSAETNDKTGALQRPFAMLEFIVRQGAPVAPGDIAESLGIPKPTVYRLIENLEAQGLLQRQFGAKRVSAGPRLIDLAFDVLRASVRTLPAG